jgi:hypothetical protein
MPAKVFHQGRLSIFADETVQKYYEIGSRPQSFRAQLLEKVFDKASYI